jgi:hypothetical protein
LQLSDREKQLSPYKLNEILIFKSNLGNIDSLKVANVENDYTNPNCNWEVSSTQDEYLETILNANICRDSDCDVKVSIHKRRKRENRVVFQVFGFSSVLENMNQTEPIKLVSTGKVYDSVYAFKMKIPGKEMKSFFWDKKNGLIKYETEKEVFELVGQITANTR